LGVLGTLQVIQPSRSIDGRANLKWSQTARKKWMNLANQTRYAQYSGKLGSFCKPYEFWMFLLANSHEVQGEISSTHHVKRSIFFSM
jgi:hypothetical protein